MTDGNAKAVLKNIKGFLLMAFSARSLKTDKDFSKILKYSRLEAGRDGKVFFRGKYIRCILYQVNIIGGSSGSFRQSEIPVDIEVALDPAPSSDYDANFVSLKGGHIDFCYFGRFIYISVQIALVVKHMR
jgi:hypothetical protein